jgi:hypothetical protein
MLEKVFTPTFKAEDLHKQPNYHAIATVMMYNMPTAPFTMNLLPSMSEGSKEVFDSLKAYSATKYGRPCAEVEREINERMSVKKPAEQKVEPSQMSQLVNSMPSSAQTSSRPMVNAATEKRDQQAFGDDMPVSVSQRQNFLDKWKQGRQDAQTEVRPAARLAARPVMRPGMPSGVQQAPKMQNMSQTGQNSVRKPDNGHMQNGDVIKLH